MEGSIGPRLPEYNGESCSCGGVYVLVGPSSVNPSVSIWRCGQCDSQKTAPNQKSGQEVIKSKDFTE